MPGGLPAAVRRLGHRPRARSAARPHRPGPPDRGDAAAGWRLPDARPGPGPPSVRQVLRRRRGSRRPGRPGRVGRGATHPVAPAVRGRATAALPGPRPGRQARGGLPRRAHRRGRPRRPGGGTGDHRRPAGARDLRHPHHPRTRRGRAAGRPGADHRPRPQAGRGHPGRAGGRHRRRLHPVHHRPGYRHRLPGSGHRKGHHGRRGEPRHLPAAAADRDRQPGGGGRPGRLVGRARAGPGRSPYRSFPGRGLPDHHRLRRHLGSGGRGGRRRRPGPAVGSGEPR